MFYRETSSETQHEIAYISYNDIDQALFNMLELQWGKNTKPLSYWSLYSSEWDK